MMSAMAAASRKAVGCPKTKRKLQLQIDGGSRMPQVAFLRNRFDLTPAEAGLVLRLMTGELLQSAAKALGIKYGTARTYLKSIFKKTGACRQAELVVVVIRAMDQKS